MVWSVCIIGELLVVLQGILAHRDGFLTQAQMRRKGVRNGYSFMEHGGMWADVFVISPMVAYIASKYELGYATWYSILTLVIALAFTIGSAPIYNKIGLKYPVAHSHDGRTTPAGWIHGLFAVAALWIAGMFYFTPINPPALSKDVLGISSLLSPFFFLGIVDFNRRWVFEKGAKIQLAASIALLWCVAIIKLRWF